MPDLAYRAIAIVSRDVDEYCRPARPISLEHDLVHLSAFELAGAAQDRSFDVVLRHRDTLGRGDSGAEPRISVRIAAPGSRGNHDFLNKAGECLAALGVSSGLFVLDCRPLGMTRHAKTLDGRKIRPASSGETIVAPRARS